VQKIRTPKLSRTTLRKAYKKWYFIPIVIAGVLLFAIIMKYSVRELSIVKISTEYGTLELTQSVGLTREIYIVQYAETLDGVYYNYYIISDEATTYPVSAFVEMDSNQLPVGVQSGHEVYFVFDSTASTEEVLYFDVIVDIDGVRWDQVTVYTGTGQQLKVYQPAPQMTTGRFLVFIYQAELERGISSLMLQFKGYQESQTRNVFVTTYYSLVFSYIGENDTTTPELTTTTDNLGISPYFSPSVSIFYLIPFMVIITIYKKKGIRKDESN